MICVAFLTFLAVHCSCVSGQGHFVKDQHLNRHEFPPSIKKISKEMPTGHLRPIGHQRISDGRIKALNNLTHLKDFHQKCISARRPCLFREGYNPPALELWGDKYLNSQYGKMEVTVEATTGKERSVSEMPLKAFRKQYHYDDLAVRWLIPEELKDQLTVPRSVQCPSQLEYMQEAWLWLNSGPTATRLTYAADDTHFCVLQGRADVILVQLDHADPFLPVEKPHKHSGSGESTIDVEKINMFSHPEIADVKWKWSTANSGDCLFIPAGYLRHIRMFGRFLAVVYQTTPLDEFKSCETAAANHSLPLVEIETLWVNRENKRVPRASGPQWTVESLKKHLRSLTRDGQRLYFEQFSHFLTAAMAADLRGASDAFALFDAELSGSVDAKQLLYDTSDAVFEQIVQLLQYKQPKTVPAKDEL